ncbi:hypothetical protein GH714_043938 [Hevea brasiliensis]|uniref:Integrase zinc-binding domain-containing protein n=1 Tax=Hevea brasiliensis TaxID=3981 RepID=A0A6A6JZH3_HEVBR|nr:hypothetical protein GH714_043938 [Hevea brasiliensis]
MGSLQLAAIQAKPKEATKEKMGRLFVQASLGGKEVRALVDTGASDNFLKFEEAQRLGIRYTPEMGWLKAVNSNPSPIHGVARDVPVKLGEWHGNLDFSIVSMDDYSCVLGVAFMDKVKAIPIPFANREDSEILAGWLVVRTKRGSVYIPKWGSLRREVLKECHDSLWAGHPGARRTMALVERAYYWPRMVDDIELVRFDGCKSLWGKREVRVDGRQHGRKWNFSQTGLPGELGSNWVLLEQMRLSLRARAQNEVHCWHRACWAEGRPKRGSGGLARARRPIGRVGATCGRDRPKTRFSVQAGRGPDGRRRAREQQAESAGKRGSNGERESRRARDEVQICAGAAGASAPKRGSNLRSGNSRRARDRRGARTNEGQLGGTGHCHGPIEGSNWEAMGTATGPSGANGRHLALSRARPGQLGGTWHCHGPVGGSNWEELGTARVVGGNWEALGTATVPSGATGRHWALHGPVRGNWEDWALPRARPGNWEALGTATGRRGNWEALGMPRANRGEQLGGTGHCTAARRGQLGGTGHCHGPVGGSNWEALGTARACFGLGKGMVLGT